jgi:hypothetical protein
VASSFNAMSLTVESGDAASSIREAGGWRSFEESATKLCVAIYIRIVLAFAGGRGIDLIQVADTYPYGRRSLVRPQASRSDLGVTRPAPENPSSASRSRNSQALEVVAGD